MIAVALGELYRTFKDPLLVAWVFTAFNLTAAMSVGISARFGDLFGRRRLIILMLVIAVCGSLIAAISSELIGIILGRALQGATMSILPLAFGVLKEHFDAKKTATGVGILSGVYSIGIGLGTVFGGLIVDYGYWRGIFLASGAVALLALTLVPLMVPPSNMSRDRGKLDLMGGVLFAPAIMALLLTFNALKSFGLSSPRPWLLLSAGAAMLAYWVWHELNQDQPLINIRQLASPKIRTANVSYFLAGMGPQHFTLITLPILLQPTWTGIGFGLAAVTVALIKLPANLTSGAAAFSFGALARRFGARAVVVAGILTIASGYLGLYFFHEKVWQIAIILVFFLATPFVFVGAGLPTLVLSASPEERASEATGVLQVVRSLGQAAGAQLIAALLATSLLSGKGSLGTFPAESAYKLAFLCMAAVSILSALALHPWFSDDRPRSAQT